jgi:hypothetical protein
MKGLVDQKKEIAAAAILALASAFLLFGISYILFPDQISQQNLSPPFFKPEHLSDQIFWAIQSIGLAAFIAITAVGAIFIINRIRSKKTLNLH